MVPPFFFSKAKWIVKFVQYHVRWKKLYHRETIIYNMSRQYSIKKIVSQWDL